MLMAASPADPRVRPCQAARLHHSWALGGPLAPSVSTPQAPLAYLLPLLQGQVGRAQDAHTTEDPSQDWVGEVLPDRVIQLLCLLAPDLSKLLVEQGCFLLWAPGGRGLCIGEAMVLREGRKAKGSWELGLPRIQFPSSGPLGSGTGGLSLRGAVEQKLGPSERQGEHRANREP